jgi:hypothetical protein
MIGGSIAGIAALGAARSFGSVFSCFSKNESKFASWAIKSSADAMLHYKNVIEGQESKQNKHPKLKPPVCWQSGAGMALHTD